MEPGSSSPTLPDTPSTSDEDIQEASRSPSPSLLQDYEDYDIDEDVINIQQEVTHVSIALPFYLQKVAHTID